MSTLAGCPQAGGPAGREGDSGTDSPPSACALEAANAACWTLAEGCSPEDVVLAAFPDPTDADPYVTYGLAASFLSDLDGDGRAEVAIGALDSYLESHETGRYNYSTPPQRFVFLSSTLCTPSIAASSVSARVVSSSGMVGQPVATVYNDLIDVGDLDGDGLAESAILDLAYFDGPRSIEVHAGASILAGGEIGPDAAVGFIDAMSSAEELFTYVSQAGAVDGDHLADMLVGSPSGNWLFSGAGLYGKVTSTSDAWLALPFGEPCGGHPFDYDGDGVADVCQGAGASFLWSGANLAGGAIDSTSADVELEGDIFELGRLPDVDGDGRDDLVREVWEDGENGGVTISVVPAAVLLAGGPVTDVDGSFFITSAESWPRFGRALSPGQGIAVHTIDSGAVCTIEVFDSAQIRAGGEVAVLAGAGLSPLNWNNGECPLMAAGTDVGGGGAGDLLVSSLAGVTLYTGP